MEEPQGKIKMIEIIISKSGRDKLQMTDEFHRLYKKHFGDSFADIDMGNIKSRYHPKIIAIINILGCPKSIRNAHIALGYFPDELEKYLYIKEKSGYCHYQDVKIDYKKAYMDIFEDIMNGSGVASDALKLKYQRIKYIEEKWTTSYDGENEAEIYQYDDWKIKENIFQYNDVNVEE